MTYTLAIGQGQRVFADFTLKEAKLNKSFSLSSLKNSKAIIIIFKSNVCPYSLHYESRIVELEETAKEKGVSVVLINSNFNKKENSENIKDIQDEANNHLSPYLIDEGQVVVKLLGAKKNPEAFLIVPENEKFKIVYQGAIDDNPQVETDVKNHYLVVALNQLLNGQKVEPSFVNPTGCVIKK